MHFKNMKEKINEIVWDFYNHDYLYYKPKRMIYLFEESIDFIDKNNIGFISIPYLGEKTFLNVMNTFIKNDIQIKNFQTFETFCDVNQECIEKVYIQYEYKNPIQVDPNWDSCR